MAHEVYIQRDESNGKRAFTPTCSCGWSGEPRSNVFPAIGPCHAHAEEHGLPVEVLELRSA